MKHCKTYLCLSLVLVMLFVALSGCGQSDKELSDGLDTGADDTSLSGDGTFSYSDGIDENGLWKGVKALDYVEGLNYLSLQIPSDVHQISDDSIQTEIDNILTYYPNSKQILDREVADGDTVNIDYVGSVDGVEFDGGSTGGGGAEVTIGVTNYIEGFLGQLIGHMPGDTFDLEVTFPETYEEESLRGKDAVFVTTINYIVEQGELTDGYVAENLFNDYGWSTVKEMKDELRTDLQKNAIKNYIGEYLVTETTVHSVPEQMTKYQEQAMLMFYQEYATSYSMELEEFLTTYVGVAGVEELIENNRDNNKEAATYYLILQAVAEDAGLSVNEADLTNYFTEYMGTSDYASFEEQYGLPYIKQIVLSQKVVDYIIGSAVLA